MKVASLFTGVGGIEIGLERAGHDTVFLCESDPAACRVLSHRFPNVDRASDVRQLDELPRCDIVAAGFPCQDLSQAGRTEGINGKNSSLVGALLHLLEHSPYKPTWLLLENVPFMLHLRGGVAMHLITEHLERMGWAWAYRTIDTRSFGLPHRRNRVILLASRTEDPRSALLGPDAGAFKEPSHLAHACGFYWTEGNKGVGWAASAIPPLKGGSGVAIPSPPAIWFPRRHAFFLPSIENAERLQGFEAGWTEASLSEPRGANKRWRLVGNAVSVPLSRWLGERLAVQCRYANKKDERLGNGNGWPSAGWGRRGKRYRSEATPYPVCENYVHLAEFLQGSSTPLSHRAASGFLSRLKASTLRVRHDFVKDLEHYVNSHDENAENARRPNRQQENGGNQGRQSERESPKIGIAPARPPFSDSSPHTAATAA